MDNQRYNFLKIKVKKYGLGLTGMSAMQPIETVYLYEWHLLCVNRDVGNAAN